VQVRHTFKEANNCADALANLACECSFSLNLYKHCPAQISFLFLVDLLGI